MHATPLAHARPPLYYLRTRRSRSVYPAAAADTLAVAATFIWAAVALLLFVIAYSNDTLKAMHWCGPDPYRVQQVHFFKIISGGGGEGEEGVGLREWG